MWSVEVKKRASSGQGPPLDTSRPRDDENIHNPERLLCEVEMRDADAALLLGLRRKGEKRKLLWHEA